MEMVSTKLMRMTRRLKMKYVLAMPFVVYFLYWLVDFSGALLHLQELEYHSTFSYPLEGDFQMWMSQLKMGKDPEVKPVNTHPYFMLKKAKGKCLEADQVHYKNLRVVYIVKSALTNFEHRKAIRRTWGYEKRFSDVNIKTVFLLGSDAGPSSGSVQPKIEAEAAEFNDIIQGDFIDTYYNNTLKTMMGLRWAVEQCPTSRFYFFVDDDYYVSTRNVLRFLRNPVQYPHYLEEPVLSFDEEDPNKVNRKLGGRRLNQLVDFDLPEDVKLFAGYVFMSSPLRHKSSKWFVTLEEYPFDMWPPYVTAGAYILSRNALVDMYYGSYFVKKFRFDDIYLGLIAKKVDIEPFHCKDFHFDRLKYSTPNSYKYVVASHGFGDPKELERFWNRQKESGNA